jgi:glycerate 2-kinase
MTFQWNIFRQLTEVGNINKLLHHVLSSEALRLLKNRRRPDRSLGLALGSFENAIKAVDPVRLIYNSVKLRDDKLFIKDIKQKSASIDLKSIDSVYLVGAGKATARMARALHDILDDKISGGAITIPYGSNETFEDIFITHASHPLPDASGVKGSQKIVEILRRTTPTDLVVVLISGGGSSLMPLPSKNLPLHEKQYVTNSLILSGASIEEINIVRKHLSRIKGGQMLRYMNKDCRLVSLIISDVINDKLDVIASGPTCPDTSTFEDAARVLRKYGLWTREHNGAKTVIQQGIMTNLPETIKPGDAIFQKVTNFLIGNNDVACAAAVDYLKNREIETYKMGSTFDGEAKYFGRRLAIIARGLARKRRSIAFVQGGETVVKIDKMKKYGMGGRNQEVILAAALELKDLWIDRDITLLCAGTDGIDGNSDAAGAFLNSRVISDSKQKNLDARYFLKTHNSYSYFEQLDSLIKIGQTGTNVNDISIICKTM